MITFVAGKKYGTNLADFLAAHLQDKDGNWVKYEFDPDNVNTGGFCATDYPNSVMGATGDVYTEDDEGEGGWCFKK